MKQKVLVIFGTRPEAIKMAPLVKEFKRQTNFFDTKVCLTAQHREMVDQVMNFFDLVADYDLNLMKPNQNLYSLTAAIVLDLKEVLEDFKPDFVFVHGDTTTTMAASIASFYAKAKLCHVEAGLRTNNKYSPYPEEMNRQITGRIADFHFAPTKTSKENLLNEGIREDKIVVTGNTVIDALLDCVHLTKNNPTDFIKRFSNSLKKEEEIILVTGHRRENHGQGFEDICQALKKIAKQKPNIRIIYPVHLNPKVKGPVTRILSEISNIDLIEPLSYPDFVWLMDKAKLIITDSGGVQEEAPSLGKPVLVLRNTTERPEAVEAGTVKLVGTDTIKIVDFTLELLNSHIKYQEMSQLHNPYGDGMASKKIVQFIKDLQRKV
ncbi:UDP-N-acetyl glucosamine 2-epimerase [Croceivirga lutea]|uniref:non-hydrolyzing UDP-N-acetylglucosamine 2-epimerase n=1 Tax=Croceivirga lutea TaxID=1775167 RepID=UPI0016395837|nr:UDP-N-acetylglucosamine 2-epimerase (non-hydrolyzing) [Croceivirga lutea]GGG55026.1 UDP-N-acetyl glucosamine 2-epimerase [Croceivirga lutea]